MAFYQKTPDIIIRNGTIVDGTGKPLYYADIAVVGDKIDYIGDLRGVCGKLEIDASGKYVTPGFIDSHAHSDQTIWGNPEAQSAVRQGVTTEIVGNCGFSMRTLMDGVAYDEKSKGIDCVYNLPGPSYPKGSMAATLDKVEQMGTSINTAWLCGHNDLRVIAGLHTTDYTKEQFQTMADFLREAMEAGFIGFSTGLEFAPGVVSRPEEVERLAAIAAEYDANYSTHMRDEGTYLFEAIEEFLNVIRKTGMRGTISHLNVKYDNGIPDEYLEQSMQMLRDAREKEHLNVYADMLPTCFASGDALAMLPPWLYADGWESARKILADPEGRARVKADLCRYWRFLAAGQWDRLLYIQPPYMPEICTTPFSELVKASGKEPVDFFLDVMQAAPAMQDVEQCLMQGVVFHEQTMIDSVVKDPIYMWMTDSFATVEEGPLAHNTANIQNYMSMTYFFAHYVRDAAAIPIEKALMKVSSIPAQHYQLRKRGVLAEGYYADINVFDIDKLQIQATFAKPNKYCTGMDYVIVNGEPVIAKGEHTKARPGQVLRHKV
ncbi:MAG: amidohydrolase family protein [Roseburia sp.]|nr:amidohydrolase family protein [Roseburia sp.]